MIDIKKIDDNTFNVTVEEASVTNHRVVLTDKYSRKLASGKVAKEELIKQSFIFLLEREDNTMILREFDLPTIQRYFPEFERDMKARVQ